METVTIDQDIRVFYIMASSYPDGVLEAHQKLHALVPFSTARNYFGVSRPENGPIVYRAAAEEKKTGEAQSLNCDTLDLKKGRYISLLVNDFRKNPEVIGTAFEQLLLTPGLDPQGYCVEWYFNDREAVRCMIRLKD